jgi:thiol-disulfide isomerase/thioredoxin
MENAIRVLVFLAGMAILGCASRKAESGEVLFKVKSGFPEGSVEAISLAERGVKILFGPKFVRTEEVQPGMADEFSLLDRATNIETAYISAAGKKYAVSTGEANMRLNPKDGGETKKIAGFFCRKATIDLDGTPVEVFYTDELGYDYCPFGQMKGFVLEYNMPGMDGKITFTASQVQAKPLPDSLFVAPEGYTPIKPFELQRMVNAPRDPLPAALAEGTVPSDFQVTDMEGKKVALADFKGKVVVLNYWFIACQPCVAEMPLLNQLVKKYKGKDVVFLAVTFDGKEQVQRFLGASPFDYRIFPDERAAIKEMGIMAFPTNAVLDKEGRVVASKAGYSEKIGTELARAIDIALK